MGIQLSWPQRRWESYPERASHTVQNFIRGGGMIEFCSATHNVSPFLGLRADRPVGGKEEIRNYVADGSTAVASGYRNRTVGLSERYSRDSSFR